MLLLVVCGGATFLVPELPDDRVVASRVELLRVGEVERLFTPSRFVELALLVVELLFTSLPLRVPEFTVPLVEELLVVLVLSTLPDLVALLLLLLLELSGV